MRKGRSFKVLLLHWTDVCRHIVGNSPYLIISEGSHRFRTSFLFPDCMSAKCAVKFQKQRHEDSVRTQWQPKKIV